MAEVEALLALIDEADDSLLPLSSMYKDLYTSRIAHVEGEVALPSLPSLEAACSSGNRIKGLDFLLDSSLSELDIWVSVVRNLTFKDVSRLSIETRVRLLFFLCDEVLATAAAKAQLESALDFKQKLESCKEPRRSDAVTSLEEEEEEDVEEVMAPTESFSRSGRRLAAAAVSESLPINTIFSGSTLKRGSGRKSKLQRTSEDKQVQDETKQDEIVMDAKVVEEVEKEVEEGEETLCRARQEPIGMDREGNLYWVFFSESVSVRQQLLCQRRSGQGSSSWLVYSDIRDVNAVFRWLNENTRGEAALKHFIASWMHRMERPFKAKTLPLNGNRSHLDLEATAKHLKITSELTGTRTPVYQVAAFQVTIHLQDGDAPLPFTVALYQNSILYVREIAQEYAKSSLKPGDILLCLHSTFLTSPSQLETLVGEQLAKRTGSRLFPFLILRYGDVECSYMMTQLLQLDELLLKSYSANNTSSVLSSCLLSSSALLMGAVLSFIIHVSNAYAMPTHALAKKYLQTTALQLQHILSFEERNGKDEMDSEAILTTTTSLIRELEEDLVERGLVLTSSWLKSDIRPKWLLCLSRCTNLGQISFSLLSLSSHVDWSSMASLTMPLSRPKWLDLVESSLRCTSLPALNDVVLYYSEGHEEADDGLPVWGESPVVKGRNRGASPKLCRVVEIGHYAGGPYIASRCFPFMLVVLERYPPPPPSSPSEFFEGISSLPPALPSSSLAVPPILRHLSRITHKLMSFVDYEPFRELVSLELHPDYYSIVLEPVSLQSIQQKLTTYNTIDSFLVDIEKIRSNCKLYCSDKYPEMVLLAEQLVNTARLLVKNLVVNEGPQIVAGDCYIGSKVEDGAVKMNPESTYPQGDALPQRFTVALRLHASKAVYIVKRAKHETGIELLLKLELNMKVRVRVIDQLGSRMRLVNTVSVSAFAGIHL